MSSSNLPAILGGTPVRTAPYPVPNFIGANERALVDEVLETGVLSDYVAHEGPSFAGGRMVKRLEAEYCERFGVRHAISVNSAASALHAAVAAALAGLGDEVIVPAYTMSATATAVAQTNATPVFADIEPGTFGLDPVDVERKITGRTKAVIAVNLFGSPAKLDALRELCDRKKILLIEDNAQAPGAKRRGRFTATWGDIGIFSFNCHKTIQCGEGGMLVTNDATLADRLRLFRNHGEVVLSQRQVVPDELLGMLGYNYRLTELQSAIALAQTRRLDELTEPRIAMARTITEGLTGVPGIVPPTVEAGDVHVYYLYTMRIDPEALGLTRKELKAALDAEGLPIAEGYVRPIYLYPMYSKKVADQKSGYGAGIWHPGPGGQRYERGLCPVTEKMHFEELLTTNICRADLGEEDARGFVRAIRRIVEHRTAIRERLSRATAS